MLIKNLFDVNGILAKSQYPEYQIEVEPEPEAWLLDELKNPKKNRVDV
jgi:hypothetical protein